MLRGGVLLIGGGVSLLIRGAMFSLHLSFHRSISSVGSVDACGLWPFKSPPPPPPAPPPPPPGAAALPLQLCIGDTDTLEQDHHTPPLSPPLRFVPLQSGFDALMFLSEGE